MKNFIKFICILSALSIMTFFAGCNSKDENSAAETTVQTEQVDSTEAVTTAAPDEIVPEVDLNTLHAVNYEGNDFAGAWKITEGEGSQFENFVYVFDGDSSAYLMTGTMGYCGKYEISSEKKQIATQLMFGINGKYTYEFSDDKNSAVLTNTDGGKTTTIEKIASYSYIPIPETEPKIDEALLGAWSDDSGGYVYFDKSGIMYETQEGLSFTFYTYSASEGSIEAVYYMNKKMTDTMSYKVNGDTLKLNDYDYTRISSTKLV